MYIIPNLVLIF